MTTPILRSTPATAQFFVYQDGTLTNFDATPTHTAVDATGTTVTLGALSNPSAGTYNIVIAAQAALKHIIVSLVGDVSTQPTTLTNTYEVVGGFLYTETQARTFAAKADATSALIPLASATEYTDNIIGAERDRVTEQFEEWTGRSWIPRYARVKAAGNGRPTLMLSNGVRTHGGPGFVRDIRTILSCTIDGTTIATADIEFDNDTGILYLTAGWTGPSSALHNVIIEYEYGLDAPIKGVDRQALMLTVQRLVPSAIPYNALSTSGDYGSTRYVTEGGPMRNPTRIPEVNEWLAANRLNVGFA
jgi:hypothetical protein